MTAIVVHAPGMQYLRHRRCARCGGAWWKGSRCATCGQAGKLTSVKRLDGETGRRRGRK